MVAERDANGKLIRRYVYGLDLLNQTTANKGPYWYHHDGLGSVSDITSASGTPLWWAEYQPYGLLRESGSTSQAPVNPFGFTGQYQDTPTGLYYLRARQYDPTTGRFLAPDPTDAPLTNPYITVYGYAGDQPTSYADPSGRCFGPLIELLPVCIDVAVNVAAGVAGYVAATVSTNVVHNWASGQPLGQDPLHGLNPADIAISGAAGGAAGPLGGEVIPGVRVIAGALLGCAASLTSQFAGGRNDRAETQIGCLAGAVSSTPVFSSRTRGVLYGILVAIAQGLATYAEDASRALGVVRKWDPAR